MNDPYQFVVSDYFGTGEGNTVCILITRAYPIQDDYEVPPSLDGIKFVPGKLRNSAKFRATREFIESFDKWYSNYAENLSRKEFLQRFSSHLPPYVEKILNSEPGKGPGNFNFKLQLHMNFS